jgi:hypothetical protein
MSTWAEFRRRTPFRFTLRVLLVTVTLLCIGLAVWAQRAREQRRIVERIQQSGGMVCYAGEGPVPAEPRSFAVEWLAGRLGRDYVEEVRAALIHDRAVVADAVQLHGLETLGIYDTELTDQDLAPLTGCRNLKSLLVHDTYFLGDSTPKSYITDKSLALIAKLRLLESAELHGAGFTRTGIDAQARSPRLASLEIGLCDQSVVASDFEAIKRLGRIQSLTAWRVSPSDLGDGIEVIVQW